MQWKTALRDFAHRTLQILTEVDVWPALVQPACDSCRLLKGNGKFDTVDGGQGKCRRCTFCGGRVMGDAIVGMLCITSLCVLVLGLTGVLLFGNK